MLNKQGIQTPYILQLGEGNINVMSMHNGKVKATLSLSTAHGRLVQKQDRD